MMTSSSLTEINSAGTVSRTKVKVIDYVSAALCGGGGGGDQYGGGLVLD